MSTVCEARGPDARQRKVVRCCPVLAHGRGVVRVVVVVGTSETVDEVSAANRKHRAVLSAQEICGVRRSEHVRRCACTAPMPARARPSPQHPAPTSD